MDQKDIQNMSDEELKKYYNDLFDDKEKLQNEVEEKEQQANNPTPAKQPGGMGSSSRSQSLPAEHQKVKDSLKHKKDQIQTKKNADKQEKAKEKEFEKSQKERDSKREPVFASDYTKDDVLFKLRLDNTKEQSRDQVFYKFPDNTQRTLIAFENDQTKVNVNVAIRDYFNRNHKNEIEVDEYKGKLFVKHKNFMIADCKHFIDVLRLESRISIMEIIDYIMYRQMILHYKTEIRKLTFKIELINNEYQDLIFLLYFMEKSDDFKQSVLNIDKKNCNLVKKTRYPDRDFIRKNNATEVQQDGKKDYEHPQYVYIKILNPIEVEWSQEQTKLINQFFSENSLFSYKNKNTEKIKSDYNITDFKK